MEPSLVEEMESILTEANATSKGDFIRQAIKFYMAFLRQGKSIDFISPLLGQAIKSQVESVEQNMSRMLFKVAVEQGKIANMLAYHFEIPGTYLDELHRSCAKRIAETNGIISLEDANDIQNGE